MAAFLLPLNVARGLGGRDQHPGGGIENSLFSIPPPGNNQKPQSIRVSLDWDVVLSDF
jgi:hypothetical protein